MHRFLQSASLLTLSCLAAGLITPRALLALGEAPVRVEGGLISGVTDTATGVTSFKGIPFAAPPVGDLRWREPMPVSAWTGVRKADTFSAPCAQALLTTPRPGLSPIVFEENLQIRGPVSEDCLYLNVWTAAKAAAEQRPVMVWIPGGGFTRGSAAFTSTDGAALARKGVVVVSVNYRLGVLGFLAHPELTTESPHRSSGHYGFLDQIAALQWVQKNIAGFGGDPRNVTLFGQSAGSISANVLMASPLARGLFHRVIGTSGPAFPGPHLTPIPVPSAPRGETQAEADQRGLRFANSTGAASMRDMRARSAEDLVKAANGDFMSIAPVDGWLLPDDVVNVFRTSRQNDVPMLIGWNANESSPVAPTVFRADVLRDHTRRQYGPEQGAFERLYPAATDDQARAAFATYISDLAVGFPMRAWARAQRRTGKSEVFVFFFERAAPDAGDSGAGHGAEVTYAFHNIGLSRRPFDEVDRAVSEVMSSYLVQFARAGNPNAAGLPAWPAYDEQRDTVLVFGDRVEARVVPRKAALDFFEVFFSPSEALPRN
jgi:para-nitrobenzyl esterase